MTLEAEVRKELRNTKIRRAILGTLQLTGALTLLVVAPNVLDVLGRELNRRNKMNVRNSLQRMINAGLIERKTMNGRLTFSITAKGTQYLYRNILEPKKPLKWDGKWRIVIFDIPQSRRTLRNKLRASLIEIGFLKLQASVWIYPYDCEDLMTLLKTEFRVGKDVLYIIADKLERDSSLRKEFGLSR
jgi:CRISPR-associated endonuclease Cas2